MKYIYKNIYKKTGRFLVVAVLMIMIAVAPVRPALAVCETNQQVTAAQTSGIAAQINSLTNMISGLQLSISLSLPIELLDLQQKIMDFSMSFLSGLGDRMWGGWNQNQKDQTAQLNVAVIDQSAKQAAAEDAGVFIEQARKQEEYELALIEEYTPNENSCTFDTVMPHQGQVDHNQRLIEIAMTEEFNNMMLGSAQNVSPQYLAGIYGNRQDRANMTPLPTGWINTAHAQRPDPLQRSSVEYDRYLNLFCNILENGGAAPCQESGARVDDDIEISRVVFGRDTLNMDGGQDLVVLGAIVDNLAGRPRTSIIPQSAIGTPQGRAALLEQRSITAQINASVGLFWSIIAERLPSRTEKPEVSEMRVAAGVPENETSLKPSKYEMRQAFVEYVNSPPFILSLTGDENKMAQSDLHLKALRLMMMNELNRKMEYMATMLSIQLANQLGAREAGDQVQQ